jgi:hypothetical protein
MAKFSQDELTPAQKERRRIEAEVHAADADPADVSRHPERYTQMSCYGIPIMVLKPEYKKVKVPAELEAKARKEAKSPIEELVQLRAKCLKADGTPKANANPADIARIAELEDELAPEPKAKKKDKAKTK